MKPIDIDLCVEKEEEASAFVQAIKAFLSKHKTSQIRVFTTDRVTALFKNVKGVEAKSCMMQSDAFNHSDEITKQTFDSFKKDDAPILISIQKEKAVLRFTKEAFDEVHTPFTMARFLTNTPNRFCFLADCTLHPELTTEEALMIEKKAKEFLSKTFQIEKPTTALLNPITDKWCLGPKQRELFDALQDLDRFQGLKNVEDAMLGKEDLYLADSTTSKMFIDTARTIYSMYYRKAMDYKEEDFKAKIAFFFGKQMNQFINKTTSANLDATGRYLLGYPKPVLIADQKTNYGGYYAMLENATRYVSQN